MDKRTLLAFAVTILLFAGYSGIMKKNYPVQPSQSSELSQSPEPSQLQSAQGVTSTLPTLSPKAIAVEIEAIPDTFTDVDMGKFVVTYSNTKGYIKSLALTEYPDIKLPYEKIGLLDADSRRTYSASVMGNQIDFVADDGVKKAFTFKDYLVTLKLSPQVDETMLIVSNLYSDKGLEQRSHEVFYKDETKITRKPVKNIPKAPLVNIEFAGFRNNYFCFSLLKNQYNLSFTKTAKQTDLFSTSPLSEISFFCGPQLTKELEVYDLAEIVHYGFFHFFSTLIIKLLNFIYSITHNWGISIILLASIIFVALFPFTASSTKTIKAMQAIQPEIEELRKKYADNPQKLNKETLELYKTHKINYLGGCLPMFFQLPIFIALYQAFLRMVELKNGGFLWINDLTLPDHLIKLPFGPPLEYLNILPIAITILAVIQQKINTPAKGSSQQKSMGMFFALFMGVIFYNFPSCLVLYWFVQNLLTLIYQSRIQAPKVA